MTPKTRARTKTRRVPQIFLITMTIVSALLFSASLIEIQKAFNPIDWIENYRSQDRLRIIESWDIELFSCANEFALGDCLSVSGRYTFAETKFPLQEKSLEKILQLASRATHVVLRHTPSDEVKLWLKRRNTEEYLRPKIIFFKNARCFATRALDQKQFCASKTEVLDIELNSERQELTYVFTTQGSTRFGPQLVAPFIVESQLLAQVLGLEDKARAAFATEGILAAALTVFLGLLALIHFPQPAVLILFGLSFFRTLQLAISYVFESRQSEAVFQLLGAHGYSFGVLLLNCIILAHLLYFCSAFVNRSFRVSNFEIGYGLAVMLVFIGLAFTYSSLNEIAVVSTFVRDTIGSLFAAIWVMYRLLMNWNQSVHGETLNQDQSSGYVQTFLFLFFLVSYGSAGAQSAINERDIPDVLVTQNILFLPGLCAAVMIELWLTKRARSAEQQDVISPRS